MNISKRHTNPHNSSTSHPSTSFNPRLPINDVPIYVLVSTHITFFAPHFRNSKCIASHSLTFNLDLATREIHPSSVTRSHVPSFSLLKRVKLKSTMIHLWLHKKLTHVSRFRTFPSKRSPYLIQTAFWPLFKLWITNYIFQHFLDKWPPNCQEDRDLYDFTHYVSWTSFPADPIHFLPNFQLSVMSYILDPLSCLKILKSFLHQNPWSVFKIPVVDLS